MNELNIIATVRCFPISNSLPTVIDNLLSSNVTNFRINVGRDNPKDILSTVDFIINQSEKATIILDVSLPKSKVRIKSMDNPAIDIVAGEKYKFVNYKKSLQEIEINYFGNYEKLVGRQVIYGDGIGALQIIEASTCCFIAIAENSFNMILNKSLYFGEFNHINVNCSYYKETKSLIDLVNPKFVAFSFIESVEDLLLCKELVKNVSTNIKIMSKIETLNGIKNVKSISDYCDAIMLGRGDLGVTAPIWQMSNFQENVVRRINNKKVEKYVATDIMTSMKERFQPSRADIIDIAKIFQDGYDGVVLPAYISDKDNIKYTIDLIRNIYEVTSVL